MTPHAGAARHPQAAFAVVEVLVLACLSAALCMVALQGFVVEPALQFNAPLLLAVSLALQAPLQAAASARRRTLPRALGFAALAAALVAWAVATSAGADPAADEEGNRLAFACVLVAANLAAFSLSRRPAGLAVLALALLATCGWVEFAYHAGLAAPTAVACAALVALAAVRSYARSARAADVLARPAPVRAAVCGALLGCVAAGAACALFALAIAPLNPGRVPLKLFVETRGIPTVEVSSPRSVTTVEDPDELTANVGEDVVFGSLTREVDADEATLARLEDFVAAARRAVGQTDTFALTPDEDGVFLYTYALPSLWWLLAPVALAAAVAAAVLARRALRRRRRRALASHPPREQVELLYADALARLARLGLGRPRTQTPAEFAQAARERLGAFARGGGAQAGWDDVTRAYERCHYGACEPTEAQLAACWAFWDALPACARVRVGRVRWALRYYWIV